MSKSNVSVQAQNPDEVSKPEPMYGCTMLVLCLLYRQTGLRTGKRRETLFSVGFCWFLTVRIDLYKTRNQMHRGLCRREAGLAILVWVNQSRVSNHAPAVDVRWITETVSVLVVSYVHKAASFRVKADYCVCVHYL